MSWVSVHAFHQGDLDALLTAGVVPLAERLAGDGLAVRWFFLRYWDGGPHLRVRVLAAEGQEARVERELVDGLGAYLRAHPSGTLDADAYRRMAAELARMEGMAAHEAEPRPNDTAQPVPYVPERHVYGEREALAAAERHFAESSRIAAGVVAAGTPQGRRRGLALSAALLALAVAEPDLDDVAARFAAGAQAAITAARDAGMPDLSASYLPQRERLLAHARDLWRLAATGPQQDDDEDDAHIAWLRSVRALRQRLEAARAAGDLDVEPPRSPFTWQTAHLPGGPPPRCAACCCAPPTCSTTASASRSARRSTSTT
ncbi:lantibiotic dehydratase C-terminal domain-containing protein [Thermocatellispora tengchongensis]|uniref:lantibiotic dehydratase C-terminal domain-containing protein n=1 Tax=Thermocatellispora tengchongensis TaxID=1073253 RepID=UPI00362FB4DF